MSRITSSMIASNTVANLQSSLARSQKLQDQMSSGKVISKPSDNPAGATRSLQMRSEMTRAKQYSSNADDGIGWLGTADGTLTDSLSSINNVRDRLLQGANGTSDATSRAALAAEIKTVRQGLVGLANAVYNNRPIFAGTANTDAAYDANGTYLGDTGTVFRTVGDNASVQVNMLGTDVWGTGTASLFKIIDDIESRLTNGSDAEIAKLTNPDTGLGLPSDLDRLDAARINIQNRLSEVGARYHRVETMQSRADDSLTSLTASLSKIEDADLPATFVQLNIQNSAYQAALAATAKVVQPSLVDFLS